MKTNIIVTSGDRQILSGVPIGTSIDFTGETPPAGYLVEDGSAVSRTTYARLFAVIGTKYGEGDGSTTFNLPNRIGRFAEGTNSPGEYKEAGLPDITAYWNVTGTYGKSTEVSGAADRTHVADVDYQTTSSSSVGLASPNFVASRASSIYGNSETVQPASVGYLPCIKAFDAAIDVLPETIPEITEKVWNPDEGGLDVLPGVAYIVQPGYTTRELIINSLPDSYQESTIWFPVSGELPSITINCEHDVIGDLSIPETAGKCVLSVVNKTVVMGTY